MSDSLPQRINVVRPILTTFPETTFGASNVEYVDMIERLMPGDAALDRTFFGALSQAGLRGLFEEDDKLMEGRKGGAHHSYAGYLTLQGKKDQKIQRSVFIKPFLDSRDCRGSEPIKHMVHEIAASHAVSELYSYPVTFKILGVAKSFDETPQLLTDFDLSVTAISNIFRPKVKSDPLPRTAMLIKGIHIAMNQAGTWVGGLGAAHRDFHVGNVARGVEYTPWFNDNETASPLECASRTVLDTDNNRAVVLRDFIKFFHSTVNPDYTRPDVAKKVFGIFDNPQIMGAFLKTYQQSLVHNAENSGLVLPDRYYMSFGIFNGLARNATNQIRYKFGL